MPPVLVASPRVASSALASLLAAGSGPALLAVVAIFRSAAMPSAARGGFLVTVVLIVAALAAPAPTPAASPVFVVPPRVAHGDRGRPRAPSQWEIINRARVSQNFGGADDVQGFASSSPFTHRRALRFATHASSRRGALFVKVHPPTRRRRSDRSTAEFRVRGVRSHTRAVGAANGGERCPVPRVATRRRWRRMT
jgi:hypothetical protein